MAHYSYPSPDRHWALVVEMNGDGDWASCRLVSSRRPKPAEIHRAKWRLHFRRLVARWFLDVSSLPRLKEAATCGASAFPDGPARANYLRTNRRRWNSGGSEGASLITSVGVRENAIGSTPQTGSGNLSSEGEVVDKLSPPSFSCGRRSDLLLASAWAAKRWRRIVAHLGGSGKSEAVFPGISMVAYDVSPDGKQVVYETVGSRWDFADCGWRPTDRNIPSSRVGNGGAMSSSFWRAGADSISNRLREMPTSWSR